ncbi:MAG: hypothetical protein RMK99_14475 [Anaerolineales bacterium]|nr:hypothetical protein [Anaerolineales bacterium]
MTQLGFHYFPDDTHYRATDLQAWLPELKALGARWLTLIGSPRRAVPEPFLIGLKQAEIEPVIHIPATPGRNTDAAQAMALFETYARWGVRYVVVFSEPNVRASWPQTEWAKSGLVDRFLNRALPVWEAQLNAGLEPVFPALRAGGDYWDTAFLEAALAGLYRRGRGDLLKRLTFAVNLWTFGRPVSWGAGGLKAWPNARPYATPPGMQDQRGFHLFDWYNEIITARAGEPRPLLCLAGGPRLGEGETAGEVEHAAAVQEILTLLAEGKLPTNLLNVNLWLLAAPEASPFAREAWYQADGKMLAAVETVRRFASRPPKSRPIPKLNLLKKDVAGVKPITHYLLLPTFEWGVSEWHWRAALDYVKAHRPACGFSVDEAQQAQRVTLFGNEQSLSVEIENRLRRSGCEVERIIPTA